MNFIYIIILIGLCIFGFVVLVWQSTIWNEADAINEAQKIIDFRKSDHSCNELKILYLNYYEDKYDSKNDWYWYWEVRDRLVKDCVDESQLENLEFIEICQDFNYKNCNISKLEHPELYRDFNFRNAVNNLKTINGSET